MNLLTPSHFLNFKHLIFAACLIFFSSHVAASTPEELREKYEEIEDILLDNNYGAPIHLESENTKQMRGKVYGIIYHPYKVVSRNLASHINWCAIMPQHLNIKACTYQNINNQCRLIFYTGRKFYEKADDVYHLDYQFKVKALNENYFNATLNSDKGPLDTTDYIINIAAIPLTENSTFIHLSYEYKYGMWASLAMSTYFATLGRNKVGFTITGEDKNHNPTYIKGIRGVIERNSMRYFFAIKSYLDTINIPVTTRFTKKINYWFELTEKHHEQLYELDKEDYLKYKNMERLDQIRLQKEINNTTAIADSTSATSCLVSNGIVKENKEPDL